MTLDGLKLKVVGMDAVLMRGKTGANAMYETNTIQIGPGESVDAIVTAPAVGSESVYPLYNRTITGLSNNGNAGIGGQMTEVHVLPASATLPAQQKPNDL
jgi:hypothetical protein